MQWYDLYTLNEYIVKNYQKSKWPNVQSNVSITKYFYTDDFKE